MEKIFWRNSLVSIEEKEKYLNQTAITIWLTGLSGAGKSTIAFSLEKSLMDKKILSKVLDGDNLRHGLCSDLGFTLEDRSENIRRIAEVAKLINSTGIIAIVACISPLKTDREIARNIVGINRFFEVFVSTPLDVCEKNDVKGLYAKARTGLIKEFTGISSPYDKPENPRCCLDLSNQSLDSCIETVLKEIVG